MDAPRTRHFIRRDGDATNRDSGCLDLRMTCAPSFWALQPTSVKHESVRALSGHTHAHQGDCLQFCIVCSCIPEDGCVGPLRRSSSGWRQIHGMPARRLTDGLPSLASLRAGDVKAQAQQDFGKGFKDMGRRDPSPHLIRGTRKSLVEKRQKESIT